DGDQRDAAREERARRELHPAAHERQRLVQRAQRAEPDDDARRDGAAHDARVQEPDARERGEQASPDEKAPRHQPAVPGTSPPNLRTRRAYSAKAASSSSSPKSGQQTGVTYSSVYETCHSRKLLMRISPAVRMSRSGGGIPGW